jgi:BarA-like signal transduction histidine kinase
MSDINGISIWVSTRNIGCRFGICHIDIVIHHIDMVILNIDVGYVRSIWEVSVSILSSWISMRDILSLSLPCTACPAGVEN